MSRQAKQRLRCPLDVQLCALVNTCLPSATHKTTAITLCMVRHRKSSYALLAAGDLYLRPPHVLVATAVAGCDPRGTGLPSRTWQRADWLSRLSVASKQDFARLQGFRFLFIHVKARPGNWVVLCRVINCGRSTKHGRAPCDCEITGQAVFDKVMYIQASTLSIYHNIHACCALARAQCWPPAR